MPGDADQRLRRLIGAAADSQSAHDEADVFRAIGQAATGVGLNMHVALLDPDPPPGRLPLEVRHVAFVADMRDILERLLGRQLIGLKLDGEKVFPYPTVLGEGKVVRVPDALAWMRGALPWMDDRAARFVARLGGSEPGACAPLFDGRRVVGALSVWGLALDEADYLTVELLGRLAGAALGGLRLRGAVGERARLEGAIMTARRVAHEINNDLQVVVGYAEVLPELSEERRAKVMASMARAANRAADTVIRLQGIVRFEEVEAPGGSMLDLEAATREH